VQQRNGILGENASDDRRFTQRARLTLKQYRSVKRTQTLGDTHTDTDICRRAHNNTGNEQTLSIK